MLKLSDINFSKSKNTFFETHLSRSQLFYYFAMMANQA